MNTIINQEIIEINRVAFLVVVGVGATKQYRFLGHSSVGITKKSFESTSYDSLCPSTKRLIIFKKEYQNELAKGHCNKQEIHQIWG